MSRLVAAIWVLLAACASSVTPAKDSGEESDSGGSGDSGLTDSGSRGDATDPIDGGQSGPTLEIGTGTERFEEIMEGQTLPIILGPQGGGRAGGYHIWHALRSRGFDPISVEATFRTVLPSGEELAKETRRYDLAPGTTSGTYVAYGSAPRLRDCCLAEETDVVMSVDLTDAHGVTGHAEQRVHTTYCADHDGSHICP
ncbi:MAG: hypothetical protein HY791_30660 [Deltaproteobacteria bacterium]|nr:hypothetical protein [Deltaproteobacteria bacterium]